MRACACVGEWVWMCVHVHVHVCVCARVRACVRACVGWFPQDHAEQALPRDCVVRVLRVRVACVRARGSERVTLLARACARCVCARAGVRARVRMRARVRSAESLPPALG